MPIRMRDEEKNSKTIELMKRLFFLGSMALIKKMIIKQFLI